MYTYVCIYKKHLVDSNALGLLGLEVVAAPRERRQPPHKTVNSILN